MASFWGLDRGKTGVTTTVGEAIASKVPEEVTITPDMDIPVEEVPPTRVGMLRFTAPDPLITTALTPQLYIPMVQPRITTAATPQLYIPTVKPRIAKALLPKLRITMAERRIAKALPPRPRIAVLRVPLMVAANRTAMGAMNTTSRQWQ
jgi:hypothetical protein